MSRPRAYLPADYAPRFVCDCGDRPDLTLDADVLNEAGRLLTAADPVAAVAAALWARNVEIARLQKRRRR